MPLFQFVGAIVGSIILASVASIAWPKFSTNPRPEVLTQVYDKAIQTDAGQNLEQVLGSSDDVVASLSASITRSVQQTIILKLFEQLPSDQQDAFVEKLCKPVQ